MNLKILITVVIVAICSGSAYAANSADVAKAASAKAAVEGKKADADVKNVKTAMHQMAGSSASSASSSSAAAAGSSAVSQAAILAQQQKSLKDKYYNSQETAADRKMVEHLMQYCVDASIGQATEELQVLADVWVWVLENHSIKLENGGLFFDSIAMKMSDLKREHQQMRYQNAQRLIMPMQNKTPIRDERMKVVRWDDWFSMRVLYLALLYACTKKAPSDMEHIGRLQERINVTSEMERNKCHSFLFDLKSLSQYKEPQSFLAYHDKLRAMRAAQLAQQQAAAQAAAAAQAQAASSLAQAQVQVPATGVPQK